MALFIVHENSTKSFIWNVGQEKIKLQDIDGVESISADGDELVAIKTLFSYGNGPKSPIYTIPMPKGLFNVTWYGDIAKTILANLIYAK